MTPQQHAREEIEAIRAAHDYLSSLTPSDLTTRYEMAQYNSYLRPNIGVILRKCRELDEQDPIELRIARIHKQHEMHGRTAEAKQQFNKLVEVFK